MGSYCNLYKLGALYRENPILATWHYPVVWRGYPYLLPTTHIAPCVPPYLFSSFFSFFLSISFLPFGPHDILFSPPLSLASSPFSFSLFFFLPTPLSLFLSRPHAASCLPLLFFFLLPPFLSVPTRSSTRTAPPISPFSSSICLAHTSLSESGELWWREHRRTPSKGSPKCSKLRLRFSFSLAFDFG